MKVIAQVNGNDEDGLSSQFLKVLDKLRRFIQSELERRKYTEERLEERVKQLEERVAMLEDDTPPTDQDAEMEWNYDEQKWEGNGRIATKRRDGRLRMIFINDMVKMEEKTTGDWKGRSIGRVIGVTEGGNIKIKCDGVPGYTRRGNRTLEVL